MASKKKKPNEPVPEQLVTADTVGNTDQDDGGKEDNDEDKVEVRLLRSVVHDEYTHTSEREARRCSPHLMQFPITKILRDKNCFFYDLLVKFRTMVKKYSKSVNAKAKEELYKQVKLGVVVE